MSNSGTVGSSAGCGVLSSTVGASAGISSACSVCGGGVVCVSTDFEDSVCGDLVSSAGGDWLSVVLLSAAGVIVSDAASSVSTADDSVSAVAVDSSELSLLSEKETVRFFSGSRLSIAPLDSSSLIADDSLTVRSSVVCLSVFAQPDIETRNAAKRAIPIAFFILLDLLCSFIVRIILNFCKGMRERKHLKILFFRVVQVVLRG